MFCQFPARKCKFFGRCLADLLLYFWLHLSMHFFKVCCMTIMTRFFPTWHFTRWWGFLGMPSVDKPLWKLLGFCLLQFGWKTIQKMLYQVMQYLNGLMHSNVIDRKEIFHVNDKMGIFFLLNLKVVLNYILQFAQWLNRTNEVSCKARRVQL